MRRQYADLERERQLLAELADIRTAKEDRFDHADTESAYARAFAAYGLDLAALPEATPQWAEQMRTRPAQVRRELTAALDDWVLERQQRQLPAARTRQLLQLARAADPGPWRDALRRRFARPGDPTPREVVLPAEAVAGLVREPRLNLALAVAGAGAARQRAELQQLAAGVVVEELPGPSIQLLAGALWHSGAVREAEAVLRQGQRRYPTDVWLNYMLATVLQLRPEPDLAEAVGFYRAARAVRPEIGHDLAHALEKAGRREEATALFEELCRLRPANAEHRSCLGAALQVQGRLAEAVTHHRQALALDPAYAQTGLGRALQAPDTKDAAKVYHDLGRALYRQDWLEGASACYRRAIELEPTDALAHCNLGFALRDRGRFAEALAALQRGHELGQQTPGWHYPSAQEVQRCARQLALEGQLAAVLRGDQQPADAAERLELADLCRQPFQGRDGAAARFYAGAFAAEPQLADDLRGGHRYHAARAAARAAAGQSRDMPAPEAAERARLRRQALDWLRADLAAWARQAQDQPPARAQVRQTLRHWQQDAALAGVRDADALAQLPDAERPPWEQL